MLANMILHQVVPVLMALFWLILAPKGRLKRIDPLLWASFPLIYVVYAIPRGMAEGRYAYPFLDVAKLGWGQVVVTCAAIAVCFLVAGQILVWFDRMLARRR